MLLLCGRAVATLGDTTQELELYDIPIADPHTDTAQGQAQNASIGRGKSRVVIWTLPGGALIVKLTAARGTSGGPRAPPTSVARTPSPGSRRPGSLQPSGSTAPASAAEAATSRSGKDPEGYPRDPSHASSDGEGVIRRASTPQPSAVSPVATLDPTSSRAASGASGLQESGIIARLRKHMRHISRACAVMVQVKDSQRLMSDD